MTGEVPTNDKKTGNPGNEPCIETRRHPRVRGMDSAVVLAMAREAGFDAYALSVRYGQRHTSELDAADRGTAAKRAGRGRAQDRARGPARSIGGSALTDDIDVPTGTDGHVIERGIPSTYVPARNTIMLSVALGWAEVLGSTDLFCGVNAVDYSGCRIAGRSSSPASRRSPTSRPGPASKAVASACMRR